MSISHSTLGALRELLVASDLMRKGYQVFRALSPSSTCDLVGIRPDGVVERIEVTTGQPTENSVGFTWSDHPTDRFDLLAIVLRDTNEIKYLPAHSVEEVRSKRRIRLRKPCSSPMQKRKWALDAQIASLESLRATLVGKGLGVSKLDDSIKAKKRLADTLSNTPVGSKVDL
jgi:hypothetical protein